MHSISTRALRARPLAAIALLAGGAFGKYVRYTSVHVRPFVDVGKEHSAFDDTIEGRTIPLENRLDVLYGLSRFLADTARYKFACTRHDAELARQVEHITDPDRLREGK
jgi:hypothetical protein